MVSSRYGVIDRNNHTILPRILLASIYKQKTTKATTPFKALRTWYDWGVRQMPAWLLHDFDVAQS